MRVRPRRIEVHVHGKRTRPPDRDRRKKCPAFADIFRCNPHCEQQAEESIHRCSQRHREPIRSRESIGCNSGSKCASQEHTYVRHNQKRRPQNRRPDSEVIFKMIRRRAKDRFCISIFVETRVAKTRIRGVVIRREVEIVLNQDGARERVVADTVSAHPRIDQCQRHHEESEQPAIRSAGKRSFCRRGNFIVGRHSFMVAQFRRRHIYSSRETRFRRG